MSQKRMALLGDAFIDINLSGLVRLPSYGIDVPCQGVKMTVGGSCANTARQLASLGRQKISATFFSSVGDDELGALFRRSLREENLLENPDTSLHILSGVPQSCCTILAGPSDRAMISCYASNEKIAITPFRDALLAGEFNCLHIGGYFNCIGCHTSEFLDVIDALKANGTLISMDPQHDANEKWTGEDGHLKQLLPKLDVFMPNEVEIVRTADVNLPRASSDSPRTPEEALEALAAEYPTLLIVLTLGVKGLRAARGPTERWMNLAEPDVKFVDATGAGDACAAGFLSYYVTKPAAQDERTEWLWVNRALKAGTIAGACCVERAGACEKPITVEEFNEMRDREGEI